MGVATFIIFIYLAAGFENGKGLGELLSPFDLFGFIFWLYIGFLMILWIAIPNKKQGNEIRERLKKEEGDFKVMYWTNHERARSLAFDCKTYKGHWYNEWYQEMYRQEMVLLEWGSKKEKAKKAIIKERERIRIANKLIRDRQRMGKGEDDEKIKEYREVIEKGEKYIKGCEETIEKYTKKLALLGWGEYRQPLPPRTWDDVYEHIRQYGTIL